MRQTDKVVLLLEEHADQQWRLEQFLLDRGYAVLSALDSIQALDHLSSRAVIDLFLLDEPIAGPFCGRALLESCLPRRPCMRVVVLAESLQRFEMHADAYPVLLKPVDLEQIGMAVSKALRGPPVQPWLSFVPVAL